MPVYALEDHVPDLPESNAVWIAPDAQIVGNVRLAYDVSIWFGAVLRGDNELIDIGASSNVQDGAILHTDPGFPLSIGTECTVGHRAILHGCTIGDKCLIGMGAIVMNGSVVGEGSIVGAGALLTEGKIFPPYSLVLGSPAKFVRTLKPEEIERSKRSAARYVANAQRYLSGLSPSKLRV